MQPVLALAPLLAPMPEAAAEIPPSPEGAFLASLEAEATLPDASVALQVVFAVPGTAAIVLPEVAPADTAAPRDGGTISRPVTDASAVLSTVAPPVPAIEVGQAEQPAPPPATVAPEELLAVTYDRTEPALDTRSAVAVAALTMVGRPGDVDGEAVSDAVRLAVSDRGEGRSPRAADAVPADPEGPNGAADRPVEAAPARAFGRTVDASTPAAQQDLQPHNRQTHSPPDVKAAALTPTVVVEAPLAVSTPKAVTPPAADTGAPDEPSPPPPAETPDTEVEPTDRRHPRESVIRPGMWESLFSGLSLPPPAEPRPATALRPLPPVQAGTLHPDAAELPPARNTEAGPTAVDEVPVAKVPAAQDLPRADAVKTTAPLAALPLAPLEWTALATPRDEAVEVAMGVLAAQGSAAPGALHSAVAAPGPQANPMPHVAAQITAALARSADGATELALSPEELGHVRLRLEPDSANPDRMVVMITFERPETLDLFRRHAGDLAEALRAAGYAGADIGFGQDHAGSHGSNASDGGAAHRSREPPDAVASTPPSSPMRLAAGASLDLRL